MKLILFVSLTILFFAHASAQTKLIAYKSHSGSTANFKKALVADLFDIGESDYGLGPATKINLKKLDSVMYMNDSTALVKYSEGATYCQEKFGVPSKTLLLLNCTHWNSTTDTIYHASFKKKKAITNIKEMLIKKQYDNNIDTVPFIGFDTTGHHKNKQKKMAIPSAFVKDDNTKPPFDKTNLWLAAGILISAMATGLVNRGKQQLAV